MENEKVLSKVRKLLKLAADAGATEGERDNAMRMAHGLLAKYNLDMAAVEAAGGEAPDEARGKLSAEFYGRPWARRVAIAIGKLFFCSYLYHQHSDAKKTKHVFIGRKSNAITALEMTRYLVESIQREARARARSSDEGSSFARSFALGAAMKINERVNQLIRDSEKQSVQPTTGTAIVLASLYATEREKNALVVRQEYPVLYRSKAGKGLTSFEGYAQGQAYGATVSLNRQIGSK